MSDDRSHAHDTQGLMGDDRTPATAPVVESLVARFEARRDAVISERLALPCFPADPAFHEGGSLAAAADACRASAGPQVCQHYRAAGERWNLHHCPLRQLEQLQRADQAEQLRVAQERHQAIARHLGPASRVPARERRLLLAAYDGQRLRETEPMRAARELLAVPRMPAIIGWGGPMGIGKTLAACYLIARRGGLYCRAAELVRPGFELEDLVAAPLLVIDQAGRETYVPGEWGAARLEELTDSRYAEERPTVWIGNFTEEDWIERYGVIAAARFRGDGRWWQLDGESLRGGCS